MFHLQNLLQRIQMSMCVMQNKLFTLCCSQHLFELLMQARESPLLGTGGSRLLLLQSYNYILLVPSYP